MGKPPFLPYGRQCIEADDIAAVTAVLESDWLTTGPELGRFEQELAQVVGAGHAVACSSGTAALHLAAMALDPTPGEVILVPAVTFLATASAPVQAGADVVFTDVDPGSGLMGTEHLQEALGRVPAGSRAIAVFPVHLNGQCCDMPGIRKQADEAGMQVVEDAAHAIGARYSPGEKVGSCAFSDMTTFSFHPVKTVTMGEGGAVTCSDPGLAERLCRLRNHGLVREPAEFRDPEQAFDRQGRPNPWYYELHRPGLNYRASDLHCALGRSQLAKLARFVAQRRELMAHYERLLAPLAPVARLVERTPGTPAWHLCAVLIDFDTLGMERAEVMHALRERGIGSQVHYLPLHRQPWYRERCGELRLPGAEEYYRRCLSLPLFPAMTEAQVERVARALGEVTGLA